MRTIKWYLFCISFHIPYLVLCLLSFHSYYFFPILNLLIEFMRHPFDFLFLLEDKIRWYGVSVLSSAWHLIDHKIAFDLFFDIDQSASPALCVDHWSYDNSTLHFFSGLGWSGVNLGTLYLLPPSFTSPLIIPMWRGRE